MSSIIEDDVPTVQKSSKIKTSLEARREARIKKILENSKSRLEKLNGDVIVRGSKERERDVNNIIDKVIYPDPEVEEWESPPREPTQIGNPNFPYISMESDFLSTFLSSGITGNNGAAGGAVPSSEDFSQFFQSVDFLQTSPAPFNSQPTRFLKYKFHIILMAVVTYLLFYTNNEIYVCFSVLFPLLLWELTEMFLLKTYQRPNKSFLKIILMSFKLSSTYLNLVLKTMETFNKVFNDFGFFMFCFSLLHVAFTWWNSLAV